LNKQQYNIYIIFSFVLKCVLTDQRIKAIEQVHGYFSSEQVCWHRNTREQ